jgi:hypothetical protein
MSFLFEYWYSFPIVGIVVLAVAFVYQLKQPQPSFWEKHGKKILGAIFGVAGGTAAGLFTFGLGSIGVAALGGAVGLPGLVVTAGAGGLLGPAIGSFMSEETYGGKWQSQINTTYGFGIALAILGFLLPLVELLYSKVAPTA